MAVSTLWEAKMTTTETLADGSLSSVASEKNVVHSAFNQGATLNAGSSPAATLCAHAVTALTAGAKTLDLTALVGTNGAVVNLNGTKVRLFRVKNLGANAMAFGEGASNGYELLGDGWNITLQPGQMAMFYLSDNAPTVGGSAKNIDVTGTGTQTFELSVVAG